MKRVILLFLILCTVFLCAVKKQQALPAESPLLCGGEHFKICAGVPKGETKVILFGERLMNSRLWMVSPYSPLPENYSLPPVRNVRKVVGLYLDAEENVALTEETIQALCDMKRDGLLEGVRLTMGSVSFAQQEKLKKESYERYCQVYPWREAFRKADLMVPGGGESEHQLGLAVDVAWTGLVEAGKQDPLHQSRAGRMLEEKMADHGFIRRYGPDSRGEEGSCENIHLRYVGKIHAQVMREGGWTLEEYLKVLHRQAGLTVETEEGKIFISCLPFTGDGQQVLLPGVFEEGTLDRDGYALLVSREKAAFEEKGQKDD